MHSTIRYLRSVLIVVVSISAIAFQSCGSSGAAEDLSKMYADAVVDALAHHVTLRALHLWLVTEGTTTAP